MKTTRIVEGSSSIASYKYNDVKEKLTIEFIGGAKYKYFGVDMQTFLALEGAESVGKFFAANIKDKFATEKMEDGKDKIPKSPKVPKDHSSDVSDTWPFPTAGSMKDRIWPFPTYDKP
jgi:hypothetical protein